MVEEIDVYRAANQLVKRYGQDAVFKTAQRCDAIIEAGDPDGGAVRRRILHAIDGLLRMQPPVNMLIH